jgi:polysaccharide chain length determinant protein (PEP-CTERM system associated)
MMPRHYQSDARAFVDVNGLLTPLLKGLVIDTQTTDTTNYIRQTLLSRPNLEQVIHLAQLDAGLNQGQKDALIAALGREVAIRSQGNNLFTVSYTSEEPLVAKNVVESLLTIFAEKAASSSRVEMEKARKFLDDQIASYQQQLRAAEQRRADFRKTYAEYLADPTGTPRIQALRQQMDQARLGYDQAVATRDSLESQLKQIPQYVTAEGGSVVGPNGKIVSTATGSLLAQERNNLAALLLKYTDQHPDVISTKKAIAELEAQATASAAPAPASTDDASKGTGTEVANPTYEQIRLKLVDAQTSIPAAKRRLDQVTADYQRVRGIVTDIPDVDAKARDIDRDYDIIKKNHDELLARRESATLSQAADDQADRTQFRIVDPPLVPIRPSSPNLPLMFSLVLLVGIGAGACLPIAIELLQATFSSAFRLRGLGLPVIGSVTYVRRPGGRRRFIISAAGVAMTGAALLAVYGALIVITSSTGFL